MFAVYIFWNKDKKYITNIKLPVNSLKMSMIDALHLESFLLRFFINFDMRSR